MCRLALALGWKSLEAMSREMSEREFRVWMRYAAKYLFPSDRAEVYLAQIASVIAQSIGSEMTISDFMLDFGGAKKRKPEAKEDVRAIAAWLPAGGRVVKGKLRKKKAG